MQALLSNDVFNSTVTRPRTMAMLRLSRKMIFQEFGVKLMLTQSDLLEQITYHSKRSRDRNLRILAEQLQKELA